MTILYPELPRGAALEVLGEIRDASRKGIEAIGGLRALGHPRASAPPTGGFAASEGDLEGFAMAVNKDLEGWMTNWTAEAESIRSFDLALGRSLCRHWGGTPASASREGVWSFLSLVVFPDLLYRRFPDLHEARALGTRRNVLRRVWLREHILGDVIHDQANPLREDEFVQVLERTALIRTPALARLVSLQILARPAGSSREAFARELGKEVVRASGPLLLDALALPALNDLVHQAAQNAIARTHDSG